MVVGLFIYANHPEKTQSIMNIAVNTGPAEDIRVRV